MTARIAYAIARLLLGLAFFVFGLNGFLDFIPHPTEPMPAGAAAFSAALFGTGYMLQLVAGTQLAAGALLLANRLVPLALLLLAPILVNIVAFHVFLAPQGIAPGAVFTALTLALAWANRAAYAPLFAPRAALASHPR
jgi:uncharacterized membrane protein YphA (DoxX/SURF4 family)